MKIENLELSDEAMDLVVGGAVTGTYMTELASFVHSSYGPASFTVSYGSSHSSASSFGAASMTKKYFANDDSMGKILGLAEKYGSVVFNAPDGSKQRFTADDIRAML